MDRCLKKRDGQREVKEERSQQRVVDYGRQSDDSPSSRRKNGCKEFEL